MIKDIGIKQGMLLKLLSLLVLGSVLVGTIAINTTNVFADTTFTVNDAGDAGDFAPGDGFCDTDDGVGDGPCTLRAAIEEANALAGTDTIEFNIGGGPVEITLGSNLEAINETIIIDGESEPGAACDPRELMISINGDGMAGNIIDLGPGSDGSTIRGLNIFGSTANGIVLGSTGNTVECNHIGTNIGATAAGATINSSSGINVTADDNQIGGTTDAARNIISGNNQEGIFISGGEGTIIEGNYIGTNITGLVSIANHESGIEALAGSDTDNTIIGGSAAGAGNIISGNTNAGILLFDSESFVIHGNSIGLGSDGETIVPNDNNGIQIEDTAIGGQIGGLDSGEGNMIFGSTFQGIHIEESVNISIEGNVISENMDAGINITTGSSGVTVMGNFIGTDVTGLIPMGNEEHGIRIVATDGGHTIGGPNPGERNIVSDNGESAIGIEADGGFNVIQGNWIGLDSTGLEPMVNNHIPIGITDTSDNLFGGSGAGEGNVIVGGGAMFASITLIGGGAPTENNVIQGNLLGRCRGYKQYACGL